MSQARVSFISDYQLRNERVLALPKPRALTFGVPFYALVAMVIIGLTGVCITVALRAQAELHAARVEYARLQDQLATCLAENDRLRQEVAGLDADPRAIERSAREMGLVKPNEIVLTIDDSSQTTEAPLPLGDQPER